ncbi:MAG: hypothetical protein ACQERJ_06935 [Bacillota bacterium]
MNISKDCNLTELETKELAEVNGGGTFATAVVTGVVGTAIYAGANHYVKEETGQDIGSHTVDAIGHAADETGEAMQEVGEYLSN